MNTNNRKSIFKSASINTIELIKSLNEKQKSTFFLPTGFISNEAGQVGYLLNEFFNYGRNNEEKIIYKTFFGNSRIEALHGAIKIARIGSLNLNIQNENILIYDSTQELRPLFDPLELGEKKALIPGVIFFNKIEDIMYYISGSDSALIAVIVCVDKSLSVGAVNELFSLSKNNNTLTIIDESYSDFKSNQTFISQLSHLPDIIITGESLTDYEIPFAAFSTSDEIFMPLNNINTCTTHISTCGGNRLALTKVRNNLLSNFPFFKENNSIISECENIEKDDQERIKAYARYINPALTKLYASCGFDIDVVKAYGSVFTIVEKGKEKEIIDCASGGGVAIRGHNHSDIVPDVLNCHDTEQNYWGELSKKLQDLTGYQHAFPSISGSRAVDIAIVLAKLANKDKTRIIIFDNNYAGTTLISLIGTTAERMRTPFFPLYYDVLYIDPFSDNAKDILLRELKSKKISLIWFEIIQGQTGKFIPEEILKLIEQYKAEGEYLVGVDEILSGLYRTGEFLASGKKIIKPDIITLFKGLTDGTFPYGVTLVNSNVYNRASSFNPDLVSYLENLYINQLGSHISLHVLNKVVSPEFERHVKKISKILKSGFEDITQFSPYIKNIENMGLSFKMNLNFNSRIFKNVNHLFSLFMCKFCIKKVKVFFYFNRCIPALNISEEEANIIIKKLNKFLTKKYNIIYIYISFIFFIYKMNRNSKK